MATEYPNTPDSDFCLVCGGRREIWAGSACEQKWLRDAFETLTRYAYFTERQELLEELIQESADLRSRAKLERSLDEHSHRATSLLRTLLERTKVRYEIHKSHDLE